MKLYKPNYYGFHHKAVAKKFGGELTFVNEFCVYGEDQPVAVYHAARPNRKLGHKKYLLLQTQEGKTLVRGLSARDMAKFKYQTGVHCLKCDEVIYSVTRHDYRLCECGKSMIDGGRDYTRWSGAFAELVKIDLLTDKITPCGKKR